ncbi:MAG: carbohydrate kinase [Planctomycetota bacterium]|nr:carbohydrate kinase [Planctomycetota bacterium]
MSIISIGAVLWDIFDNARHIGGAPFNFSAHATRLGHRVWFVSAVGRDELAKVTLRHIRELGLDTRYIRTVGDAPTGTVRVFLQDGQPSFTINRPAAYDFLALSDQELETLSAAKPRWIYFGTLEQTSRQVRGQTRRIIAANPQAQTLYDINLRKDCYTPALVKELLGETSVLKINDEEVRAVLEMLGEKPLPLADFCAVFARRFGWRVVCVTRGADGCALWSEGRYVESPGFRVKVADTVGSGDAFAAALLHGLEQGWPLEKTADFANRLGALVASRSGAIPPWTMDELPRIGSNAT